MGIALRTFRWSLLIPYSWTTNLANSSLDTTYPGRHEFSTKHSAAQISQVSFCSTGWRVIRCEWRSGHTGSVAPHIGYCRSSRGQPKIYSLPAWGLVMELTTSGSKRKSMLQNIAQCLKLGSILRSRSGLLRLLYRVIHKSLRDFRTRLRNNQDRHGRKEHINR